MGEVLEFETVRSPLDRFLMRALGQEDELEWRSEGFSRRYSDGGVWTRPRLVLSHRSGELRIRDLLEGHTPRELSPGQATRALLDCAIVWRSLAEEGRALTRATFWLRFEDGGLHRVAPSAEEMRRLLERAHALLRRAGLRSARAQDLVPLLRDADTRLANSFAGEKLDVRAEIPGVTAWRSNGNRGQRSR